MKTYMIVITLACSFAFSAAHADPKCGFWPTPSGLSIYECR